MSILMYCQHLSGAGHYVRSYEIARAFAAEGDDVYLTDGGRIVPRRGSGSAPRLLSLPRIHRRNGCVVAIDEDASIAKVLAERLNALLDAIDSLRPDVLIVEHFPFSKWCLAPEVLPMIERARASPIKARILCSLRDLVPPSPFDDWETDSPQTPHSTRVIETLHELFDGLLIHSDPTVASIAEHVPWANRIETRISYTGYVSEKPINRQHRGESGTASSKPASRIIVSTGGARDGSLALAAIAAWRTLVESGDDGGRALIAFVPPFAEDHFESECRRAACDIKVQVKPFGPDFVDWLNGADLSISHAGYNTCANILETRTPAIVAPASNMPDQIVRARLLAERGLIHALKPGETRPEVIAGAMRAALKKSPPQHSINLDGAQRTRDAVIAFVAPPLVNST